MVIAIIIIETKTNKQASSRKGWINRPKLNSAGCGVRANTKKSILRKDKSLMTAWGRF